MAAQVQVISPPEYSDSSLSTDQENSFSDSVEQNTPCLSPNRVNSSFYTVTGLIESTEVLFMPRGASSDIPNIASERELSCKASISSLTS